MLFKKKLKGVYFLIPRKLKKELDKYLIENELKLGEYFNSLITRELQHAKDLDKWADNIDITDMGYRVKDIEELIEE